MKKIILFLLCFYVINVFASEVPIKLVKKVAINAYYLNTGIETGVEDIIEIIPISQENDTAFFIINLNEGFVIVSADNIAEPILGVGAGSNLDKDNLPSNLSSLLNEMKNEIIFAKKQKTTASDDIKGKWNYYLNENNKSYSVGQYLINTTWGQNAGYQKFCPYAPNNSPFRCIVGCGGVSTAQILRYWGYEIIPQNNISYISKIKDYQGNIYPTQITIDFEEQNYYWIGMSNASPNDNNAFLLYHAALAVKSNFGPSGTGSNPADIDNAFRDYFGLNAAYTKKSYYTSNDWRNLLKGRFNPQMRHFYRKGL